MRSRRVRVFLVALALAALPVTALAQAPGSPGQPAVVVTGNNVTVSWSAPSSGGPVNMYWIFVTLNGATFPGSPFALLAPATSASGAGLPAGNYTLFIRATNTVGSGDSPTTAFTIGGSTGGGAPGMPTLYTPTAVGTTVNITWAPPTTGGTPTAYDIEAIVQATGQVYNVAVGNQTSASFGGIAPGNFLVRIRARNASGASDWTPQQLLVVGVNLGSGALQVTLTWNSTNDMDLHVREPNGTHVYYANKVGTTATLDVDDTNGYGPENIFIREGQAAAGVYRFYIVSYSGGSATTSTIRVRLRPGAANETSVTFTRTTSSSNSSVGYLVVDVNPLTGSITEVTGTTAADELPGDLRVKAERK